MIYYLGRTLLQLAVTILGIVTIAFFLMRAIPGDPALYMLGDFATQSALDALRARLGLDLPVYQQYLLFLQRALTGVLGRSVVTGQAALTEMLAALPWSLSLAVAGLAVAVVIGVPERRIIMRLALRTNMNMILVLPSWTYPPGTDQFGRCVLSRLIYGSRVSLQVGFWVVAISLVLGTLIGALAGYIGGAIERAIVVVIDMILAFPGFLLALALVAAQGSSLRSVVIAVAIAYTPRVATVMRSVVLTIRPRPFIEASHAIGMGHFRILVRHVIPNAMAPVIVVATVSAATAILAEAGLSFLGLGVQPPTPTWGSVIGDGQAVITTNPLISIAAGLCIAATLIALNLLGDGLRDNLDPQMRRQTGAKLL